jgi:hypothetical protein
MRRETSSERNPPVSQVIHAQQQALAERIVARQYALCPEQRAA